MSKQKQLKQNKILADFKDNIEVTELREKIIFDLLQYYKETDDIGKMDIEILLKNYWKNWYPTKVKASKKAWSKAEKKGIKDITSVSWGAQKSNINIGGLSDTRGKNKNFHWEHYIPASMFIKKFKELSKAKFNAEEEKENIKAIVSSHQVVWILNEENKRLDKKYRDIKREDSEVAYKDVGIDIYNK